MFLSAGAHDESMSKLLLILVPSVGVLIGLALLLTIVCMCRRSKQYNGQHKPINRPGQQLEMANVPKMTKVPVRAREFPLSSVRFLQELGEGAFGKVYKGELVSPGDLSATPVAIKTLKANASPKVQADFRREVEMMTDLRQPNIVCLLGVCMKEEPACMLFEYMSHGDLHEYLIRHSPHSDVSTSDEEDNILDHSDMLHIATQIAAGMEYLASHHFVHRDLAARNILVGDNLTIKISDFGLSRDVYSSDYYRVQSQSLLPVRWMAPEAVLYGKFTVESDMWAFGVVLWEIYSYGLQPYYGYSNQEVIDMLRARQVLPCPEDCPARAYALMLECWHEVPLRRPSFKDMHIRLRRWKAELNLPQMVLQSQMSPGYPSHNPMHMNMAMMNGPHKLLHTGAPSHSGHSGHSGSSAGLPSHHSSTGPSNNTNTTGLTGPTPPMPLTMPAHLINGQYPRYMHANPIPVPAPIPPPPMPPLPHHHVPVHHPGLYRKPSPPGSLASGKSSSLHSSQSSSLSGSKQPLTSAPNSSMDYPPVSYAHPQYSSPAMVPVNHERSPLSPTSSMNAYNKMVHSLPPNGAPIYIPEGDKANI